MLAAASLPAQAIQLNSGRVLVGEVTDATSEGLTFRRLDNGGLLELGWNDLSTLSATRIKRLKGLLVESDEEITTQADVIVYAVEGGALDEVIGRILDRTDSHTVVKRRSGELRILSNTIRDVRKREVPALEIYTKEEFYELERARIAPGEDADRHVLLAEQMRKVGLYARALEHLHEAQRLGTSKQKNELPAMVARVEALAESSEERDLLARIRVMVNRQSFDVAAQLIEEYEQRFASGKLRADFEREKRYYTAEREKHLLARLNERWDQIVLQLAGEKARDDEASLSALRSYIEDGMAKDIFTRLGRIVDIEPEEAKALWARRTELRHVRSDVYSYGVGSWILGEDAILEGTKQGEAQAAEGATDRPIGEDREFERLQRKLKEIRRQSRQVAARRSGGREDTPDAWWRSAEREQRLSWVRAYFAEFGGQMEVTWAVADACANCQGAGYLEVLGDTGGPQKERCPACRGTRFTRTIRAR